MIAKRIPRDKATSDFARLGRYVVDARGQIDPSTWSRTADYILDTAQGGAKVGGVRVSNCGSDDPAFATVEILATQARNTRSKSDKSYHLVVSFPAGERPPLAVLNQIEDSLVAAIGFADHQRISAVHTDTDHLHIHVAINKVHPQTLRNIEPYFDHRRLMETCERLEVIHGLQRTNHGLRLNGQALDDEPTHDQQRDYDQYRSPAHDARVKSALRQSYHSALAEEPEAESLDLVRDLSCLDVVHEARSTGVLLPDSPHADLDQDQAASPDVLRRIRDGDRGHAGQASRGMNSVRAEGRAGDLEAHDGRESLQGWIKRQVGDALTRAGSWADLHGVLAQHGLRITPRGAGLVIGTMDGREHVKASQIDRALSLDALKVRLGPYQPPASNVVDIAAAKHYRQTPRHNHADTASLFVAFQRARNQALQDRAAERVRLAREQDASRAQLQSYYARKRAAIKLGAAGLRSTRQSHHERTGLKSARPSVLPPPPLPSNAKARYSALAAERAADLRSQQQRAAAQRAELAQRNPLPVWQAWLAQRAADGDAAALAVLRSRERKKADFVGAWIKALDATTARQLVFEELKPRVDKSGTVVYRVADGGLVKDTAHGIRVQTSTDPAAFLGLVLAAEKYAGQALIVDGSAGFRRQVASLAGAKGLQVQFMDPELETIRMKSSEGRTATDASPRAVVTPTVDAVDQFIAARNEQRRTIASIAAHRRWAPVDAGAASYQGRRRLPDGSEVVLITRGAELLVMPVTSAQAAKASAWRLGATIHTDSRGRFTSQQPSPGKTTKRTKGNIQ